AVAFGGWSMHIFKATPDSLLDAAKAVVKEETSPEWSTKLAWSGSNPGNRTAYDLEPHKLRLQQVKFLNVTTEMLQYGIAWPAVPQASELMNVIVPAMLQDVLTEKRTPEQAAADAADKVKKAMATR